VNNLFEIDVSKRKNGVIYFPDENFPLGKFFMGKCLNLERDAKTLGYFFY
jgi:hypothetical protein